MDRKIGVEKMNVVIIRRAAGVAETHKGPVDAAIVQKVPSHQCEDIMAVSPHIKAFSVVVTLHITHSPVDESKKIKDETRIRRSLKKIEELNRKKARLGILAHQADPIEYQNFTVLREHGELLSALLGTKVEYIEDVAGPFAVEKVRGMKPGEILLLDNVRIHTEETIIFDKEVKLHPEEQAKTIIVQRVSPLADYYVCDAFAAVHRSQPTLVGFQEVLPAAAGRLFEEELNVLTKVKQNPERPCIFILGGAKILDAFKMMRSVLDDRSADRILTTDLVAQIMLKARGYHLGEATESYLEKKNLLEFVPAAEESLKNHSDRIVCPEDFAVDRSGERIEVAAAGLFKVQDRISFISTAGGGLIRFLSGEKLVVVEALKK